jgi:hypothetical protein
MNATQSRQEPHSFDDIDAAVKAASTLSAPALAAAARETQALNGDLKPFTCIGHWQSDPSSPVIHHVMAKDGAAAIKAGEWAACEEAAKLVQSPVDPYVNTFVLVGHCEVFSTWAG